MPKAKIGTPGKGNGARRRKANDAHGANGNGAGLPPKRRRNKQAHEAILAAAERLLDQRGYMNVTVEAIATDAGVGKQTIYRWWRSKADIYMELYAVLARRDIHLPDTGAVDRDLCELLDQLFKLFNHTAAGPALAGLVAESQSNPDLGEFLFAELVTSRRKLYRQLLQRGIRRGEIHPELDIEMAVDILCGPVWYRLLLGHAPLHRRFAENFIRELMNGFAKRPRDAAADSSRNRSRPNARSGAAAAAARTS